MNTTSPRPHTRILRPTHLILILSLALMASFVWASTAGQVDTSGTQVLGSLLRSMNITWLEGPTHPNAEAALWYVRFPRIILGLLVGAGLGVAGVLLQGVFSNPLAEPGVIGVSSGAAVGAAVAIAAGTTAAGAHSTGPWAVTACAFLGGLATTAFIYLSSRSQGRSRIVTLILIGVAVNAAAGGIISFITFIADTSARDQIVFWQMGSLAGASWPACATVCAVTLPSIACALVIARRLDILSLGQVQAQHLGVSVEKLRALVIILVALIVAAGVSFTGIISFVGLVVPHAVRLLIGPSHRPVIIASALGGALTLTVSDVIARTAITGADLPIGMLTALIGGPTFFILLKKTH